MPDEIDGFTIQWGSDVRFGVPFLVSGGIGVGAYISIEELFPGEGEIGIYGELGSNNIQTSEGMETFGGDIGWIGRSLTLGMRVAESIDLTLGAQQPGENIALEVGFHWNSFGVKIIIPIQNPGGGYSGYGIGFTFGQGYFAGANLIATGSTPIFTTDENGQLGIAQNGGINFAFVAGENAGTQVSFSNGSGSAGATINPNDHYVDSAYLRTTTGETIESTFEIDGTHGWRIARTASVDGTDIFSLFETDGGTTVYRYEAVRNGDTIPISIST